MTKRLNQKVWTLVGWSAALTSVMPLALRNATAQTGGLSVIDLTLVTGREDMVSASALIANMDAGDLVAGRTLWDHDGDGIVFAETRVGSFWSPAGGGQPFEVPDFEYWEAQIHAPTDISFNGRVVGWRQFTLLFDLRPILFTPSHGFQDLPFPPPSTPSPAGQAFAVSADGSIVAGRVRPDGPFSNVPTKATMWTLTQNGPNLNIDGAFLETGQVWSNAWDVSSDGTVIVGDSGPTAAALSAARWIDESPQPLELVGSASSARFTSADGSRAVGIATVDEQDVMVQWDAGGAALVVMPPGGAWVKNVNAVNSDATAAVGALAIEDPSTPFGENLAPFVWTQQDGLEVIPENGRPEDYDLSKALGISDDGNVVVGTFQSSVIFEGDPPTLGFIWVRGTGVVLLNDLMTAAGFEDPDYWRVDAISGDGLRLLATGNPPGQTVHDTNSAIIEMVVDGKQCSGDLNGDDAVDAADLAQLLGAWGPNPGNPADFDGDGVIGAADLAVLLGAWGPCE